MQELVALSGDLGEADTWFKGFAHDKLVRTLWIGVRHRSPLCPASGPH
jgi:hypothetical protein